MAGFYRQKKQKNMLEQVNGSMTEEQRFLAENGLKAFSSRVEAIYKKTFLSNAKNNKSIFKILAKYLKANVAVNFSVDVKCGTTTHTATYLVKLRKIRTLKSLADLGLKQRNVKITPKYESKMTSNIQIKIDFRGIQTLSAR